MLFEACEDTPRILPNTKVSAGKNGSEDYIKVS